LQLKENHIQMRSSLIQTEQENSKSKVSAPRDEQRYDQKQQNIPERIIRLTKKVVKKLVSPLLLPSGFFHFFSRVFLHLLDFEIQRISQMLRC
jgi:hypothetical protein